MPVKIVLFGPESTGKSTLAKELALAFKSTWNPEYLRTFVEEKLEKGLNDSTKIVEEHEVLAIARQQFLSEEKISTLNLPLVFFDTCIHTNLIYAEHYFGKRPKELQSILKKVRYDLFLLCDIDLPWQNDPQREGEYPRNILFKKMEQYFIKKQLPYNLVGGSGKKRMQNAIELISGKFPSLIQFLNA